MQKIQTKQKTLNTEFLGNLISLEYGSGLTSSNRKGNKYPVFGSNGIVGYHNEYLIRGPGIIVGRKGSIGEVNWSDQDFWSIDTTYYVKLKNENISLKWIYYLLSQKNLRDLNSATGIPGLNRNDVYNISCFYPPLKEQQKIAIIVSKVDELIQKTEQIIEQTQRLKKGLMQRLLTKGKDHIKLLSNCDWITTQLGSIITLQRGHDLPNNLRRSGHIPIIGANGITGYHDIAKAKGPGVLIGRSGTLGKVFFIDKDYWPLNTSLYVKQFRECDPLFIYYFLHTIDYEKHNAGSTVPTMNRNLLHPITVTIPKGIENQQKIASILSNVDELIQKSKIIKSFYETLKKGLMQQLLTGKIRVKV